MSLIERMATLARRDAITTAGILAAGAWLVLVVLFWLMAPAAGDAQGGIGRLATTMAALMPLALIWLAVRTARAIAALRGEAEDLRLRLAQLRDLSAARGAPPVRPEPAPEPERPARSLAAATPRPQARGEARSPARAKSPAPVVEVDTDTLIRALNFPDGPDDAQAIAALRHALQDADHARVLRAAQDVVTLLAGQDLYMDDLPPDPAPAAPWRRLAAGERGRAVAPLGDGLDPVALDIVAGMLDRDEIFRDTAQHFLRHFDAMLARHLPQMDESQIAMLARTRSARAFVLLARIAGILG